MEASPNPYLGHTWFGYDKAVCTTMSADLHYGDSAARQNHEVGAFVRHMQRWLLGTYARMHRGIHNIVEYFFC